MDGHVIERRKNPRPKPHIKLQRGLWVCFVREIPLLGRVVGWSALSAESAYARWRELLTERMI